MLTFIGILILVLVILKSTIQKWMPAVVYRIMSFVHSNLADTKVEHFKEALSRIKTDNKNRKLEILELGIGCGENFKYFPKDSNVTILDKTDIFLPYLTESIKKNNRQDLNISKLVINNAESMVDIQSNSMDLVVHTFTLCSVGDFKKVLNECYRVLKSGGVAIFMEHSLDVENLPRRLLQRTIRPMCGDCKFLDMKKVLNSGSYDEVVLKKYKVETNFFTFINPVVYGYGIKN
ncbi:unnamed protein product [Brachionus calyciflorus]|uniref:Methyltransferase type 11 domain-containing protein n=1 Tax=Brachionus calyciflorus TaxID=104777 RepID=A0A813NWT0_9BILA|nr:unnamed protein product [Brachionus calyciflorus]